MVMNIVDPERIRTVLPEFEKHYAELALEPLIKKAQDAFRAFWNDKIMNEKVTRLTELEDLDPIIRLLDVNGKQSYEYSNEEDKKNLISRLIESGKQYGLSYEVRDDQQKRSLVITGGYHAAKCMITQRSWYTIFNDLKNHPELRDELDALFKEKDLATRISIVDKLKELNARYSNKLTTRYAVPLNAILHCHDPYNYTSVVSLRHRRLIIGAFGLGEYPVQGSYGEQVILSNELLKEFNRELGISYDATKLSHFFYFPQIQEIWEAKEREPPAPREKPIAVKSEQEHVKIQYKLIELGNSFPGDLEVWVASNDRGRSFAGKRFADMTVDQLPPLGLSEQARRIIEKIDVIWLREDMPVCAFEIETTTSIYSGLLRLSDLVASAPAITFPIYIVAPKERSREVKAQLMRPTFKKLKLPEKCKFIAIEELEKDYENIKRFGAGPEAVDKIAKSIDQL